MLPGTHDQHESRLLLRPTRVRVRASALHHNFHLLARAAPGGPESLLPVVKANAYGHGILPVSRELLKAGAKALAVGFLEEGILLREEGIDCPILVMGGLVDYQIEHFLEYDLQPTLSSIHKTRQLAEVLQGHAGTRVRAHLKVDLDMERIGVHEPSAEGLVRAALEVPGLEVAGVYSHFANADALDTGLLQAPLERFLALRGRLGPLLPPDCVWHMANSMALTRLGKALGELDRHRPGLLLYGALPEQLGPEDPRQNETTRALQPVLEWSSRVVYFKVVPKGAGLSYGHRWHAPCDTRVVTVPVGYGDGYPRCLGNRAQVLIRGRRYPVVGSVCMDQLMVDLGPRGEAWNGDEVILIGRQGDEEIRVEELARLAGTIPWEIFTGISQRVPRFLVP